MIDHQEGMKINLNTWKVKVVYEGGIDPFDEGKGVLFTQEMYNELYFAIKDEQDAKSIIEDLELPTEIAKEIVQEVPQ